MKCTGVAGYIGSIIARRRQAARRSKAGESNFPFIKEIPRPRYGYIPRQEVIVEDFWDDRFQIFYIYSILPICSSHCQQRSVRGKEFRAAVLQGGGRSVPDALQYHSPNETRPHAFPIQFSQSLLIITRFKWRRRLN